jgi:hypothetical protein
MMILYYFFYFSSTISKNVAWFHIAVYNYMYISQITQAFQNLLKERRNEHNKDIFIGKYSRAQWFWTSKTAVGFLGTGILCAPHGSI